MNFIETTDRWRKAARLRVPPLVITVNANEMPPEEGSHSYSPGFWPNTVRELAYWAVVAALVVTPIALVGLDKATGCGEGLREEHQQCVGLSNNLTQLEADSAVLPALQDINDENGRIPDDAPIITVFYLGPLTIDPNTNDGGQLNGSLGELMGLRALQRAYNEDTTDWRLRIEFANAGYNFRSARFAAAMIAARAATDRKIGGVVGLAYSRQEVQSAIRTLSRAQVPMLSTTNTADATPRVNGKSASPYFFRMAAPNSAQAEVIKWWILEKAEAGGRRISSDDVVVLRQNDPEQRDIYSADLTEGIMSRLRGARTRSFSSRQELQSQIAAACEPGEPTKLLVYTGRSSLLRSFARRTDEECDRSVSILAGDDATGSLAEVSRPDEWPHRELQFISLSDTKSITEPGTAEIAEAIAELPQPSKNAASRVHANLSYDALRAITNALDELIVQQGSNAPKLDLNIAAEVHYNLRGLNNDNPLNGASGQFSFQSGKSDHSALPRTIWMNTASRAAGIEKRAVCTHTTTGTICRDL